MKAKRPFLLWLICILFVFGAFIELLKAIQAIRSWNILIAVQYQPGPVYPLFYGTLFFLLFLTAGILLWLRVNWAYGFGANAALLFSVWYWLDKFVIAVNPQPFSSEVFNFIVFIIILGLVLASLWVLKPMREGEPPKGDEDLAEGGSNE
jgi:hypothetical protein